MNNPLASSGGVGYFREYSEKNKQADLLKIRDRRMEFLISPGNICEFPTKIYVLNLDRREDRWSTSRQINDSFFRNFEVERFPAIEGKKPADSIFESFLSCLDKAFETNETIIIMEDDAYVVEGGFEKIRSAFQQLPENWDCLIGNHYSIGEIEILSEHLAKPVRQASTLNFAIYRKTICEKIRANLHLRDPHLLDIDHFITCEEVPINNFTIWPMVSREYTSFSDHKGKVKDMTMRIRENAYLYQFVDSHIYYPSLQDW